jgi:23S rRNA methylase
VGKLHYREVQIALSLLHNGGNLVIKIFTIFESDTICLMYLLACLFTSVDLFKPATSKEGNSEIYVICCDFHREVCEDLNVCSNLSKAFDPEYVDRVLAPLEDIPEQFLDKLYQGKFTNQSLNSVYVKKKRSLTEGIVTAKVLLSQNRREKEDRIGENQPFRERTLSLQNKIHPGLNFRITQTDWLIFLKSTNQIV